MYQFKDYKDISKVFWDIEEKYNLIDYEIDNIKIWQVVRLKIFDILLKELLHMGDSHVKGSLLLKIKRLPTMIYNSIFYNPYFSKSCDVLVFPHDRVVHFEGDDIDIYTKFLVDDLLKDGKSIKVLEKPYLCKHHTKKSRFTKYLDFSILYNFVVKRFINIDLNSEDRFINIIQNDIKNSFNVSFDLKGIFVEAIKDYKAYYRYYSTIFKKIRPKKIYIVVSYSYPWVVKSAKDLGIEVIELQHGTFSKYHLGYSYPSINKNLEYFPNKFYVWSKYWKDLIPFCIDYDDIIIYPFRFQEIEISKYKYIQKNHNQVIVLSQGPISNMLSKTILDNFSFFEDKIIKYKLHPGEIQRYNDYEYLNILSKKKNVEIILKGNLYELLASCEYQIGVSSTAIYEGLEFGLKTILVDLPGIEYMENLVKNGMVKMILKPNNDKSYVNKRFL
jgi:hypothetical protein